MSTHHKKCNRCGTVVTSDYDGFEHWYTDPAYTSKWLCHFCYSKENTEIWSKIRNDLIRIERPRGRN